METRLITNKVKELENFLLSPDSEENKNYVNNLLSGESRRPEDEFIAFYLSVDFWRELGYSINEIGIQHVAGVKGFVEIALTVDGKKIAVECKKPYHKMKDQIFKNELNGEDPVELKEQIEKYLSTYNYVIFTNGFYWYFYSRDSYLTWQVSKDRKKGIKPYFQFLKAEQIFNKDSNLYILNFLSRQNIEEELFAMEQKAPRHVLTDEFFKDLKTWIDYIDEVLKNAPVNVKARTTSLINKLIFVRTMEGIGIIPNGFLNSIWNEKKGVSKSTVKFIDHIDDQLSDTYNTELFTSQYIENEDGEPILENGVPKFNPLRAKNFAYSTLPEEFFSAILKKRDDGNVRDSGITRLSVNGKQFIIRSLYWWKFETIPADILGKAYETYLARKRKKLGIYYTPHQMTEFLTRKSVNLVFDKKISQLKSELEKKDWKTEAIEQIARDITNIRICDPSCGSGSFLIQAMRVTWSKYQELAKLISEYEQKFSSGKQVLDEYFSKKAGTLKFLEVLFRIKDKRERLGSLILRHIYGNDKDVNAIDTAKLNIWMETLRLDPNSFRLERVKGKRHVFPNLELNLTVGDSLIGLNIEEADKVLSKQKSVIQSILGIHERYSIDFEKTGVAQSAVTIRNGLGDFLDQEFSSIIDSNKMKEFAKKINKTRILELVKLLEPTHWSLQHVTAYYDNNGNLKDAKERGFDVIIGNPPWEILKPNIDEFFSEKYNSEDLKKFRKNTKQEKNKIVDELLKNSNIKIEYEQYQNYINLQREYFAGTESYSFQKAKTESPKRAIDLNLYKLFLEKYFDLLKKGGVAGIVLPASLLLDLGSKGLRHLIFTNSKIICLYEFENKYGIFEDLHRQYRFMNLVFQKGGETGVFDSAFYQRDINQIYSLDEHPLKYDIKLLKKYSPDTLALLEFKNQLEMDILEKLYKFPLLSEKTTDWKIRFQREFHMTGDSNLFNTEKKGWILFEGKMIHQFNHQFKKPRYWIEASKGKKALLETQKGRVLKELKKNNKNKKEFKLPEIKIDCEYYRLGWRDVTNAVDYRTLICTILPPNVFLGQTISYMRPNYFDGKKFRQALNLREIMYLCGLFNSIVVDFVIRHRVGLHATMSIVYELPIPRQKESDKYFSKIVDCVGKLVCITPEYNQLKKEAKIKKGETDAKIREEIIAQLDAYVAKIYDINEKELQYILDSFRLVPDSLKEKIKKEFNRLKK